MEARNPACTRLEIGACGLLMTFFFHIPVICGINLFIFRKLAPDKYLDPKLCSFLFLLLVLARCLLPAPVDDFNLPERKSRSSSIVVISSIIIYYYITNLLPSLSISL